jgi:hypothetical protein
MTVSDVYTLAMLNYVYVQIAGVEKAARIRADTIDKRTDQTVAGAGGTVRTRLILKKENRDVGEFDASKVIGWWLEEEDKPS